MEIRVTKSDNHNPKVFTFPDLDYEDSMAMTCAKLDEMHNTNGFEFELLDCSPIIAQHVFGYTSRKCVECLSDMDDTEGNFGSNELPRCRGCFESHN